MADEPVISPIQFVRESLSEETVDRICKIAGADEIILVIVRTGINGQKQIEINNRVKATSPQTAGIIIVGILQMCIRQVKLAVLGGDLPEEKK